VAVVVKSGSPPFNKSVKPKLAKTCSEVKVEGPSTFSNVIVPVILPVSA